MNANGKILTAFTMAAGASLASVGAGTSPMMTDGPEDILARSRAAYAALQSYSDTAEVTTDEFPPGASRILQHHTFVTFYRAPRKFFFEFRKDPKAGGERYVVWSDGGGDFNSWWSATHVREVYGKGRGTLAFALGSAPTRESITRIPPLLFAGTGLQGPVANMTAARSAGSEDVDGTRCEKLTGDVVLLYSQTGHGGAPRPTTVWIDPQTLLIRKIFEDTPQGAPPGSYNRITTVIQPRANPPLDDAKFTFVPPQK
jgi:outer membrane lipoprotein-sorting protein